MSKHTPGPWEFVDSALVGPKIDEKPIWLRPVILRSETGVQGANARLIAAAPELLEALGTLLNRLEDIGGEHVTGMEGVDADLMKANAAIAKATGEHHDN